jgi:outer membrane beta-barrel protein
MEKRSFFSYFILSSIILLTSKHVVAAEDSVYDFLWLDPDKSVYVLQNKTFRKAKTFSVEASFATTLGKAFQDTYGIDLKAQYYFTEHYGVEVFHTRYTNTDSDDFKNVVSVTQANNGGQATFPFVRRLNGATGALFLVSPFYGKINTFNKIFYFDWSFGAGLAFLDAESNLNSVSVINAPNSYTSESFTALVYKTSFKFHTSRKWSAVFDLRNMNYQAAGPRDRNSKELRSNWDFMVGVGFKFN